jgi:hypothetical protein
MSIRYQHTPSKTVFGILEQAPPHSFPTAHLHLTLSPSVSNTGIFIVCVHPCLILKFEMDKLASQ